MWTLAKIAGAIAIVVVSFFLALLALDYVGYPAPTLDQVRAGNAKQIMAALEKHRAAKGAYPVLPGADVVTSELRKPLVEGKFIAAIPEDPPDAEPTHYVSYDGQSFGLLVVQDKKNCLIEVRAPHKMGWWGQPPYCRF
jgi:hypothetical protein